MTTTLPGAAPPAAEEDDAQMELRAWTQETRRYLATHVAPAVDAALHELERLDFLWGRVRLSKSAQAPNFKAELRVEGHLVVFANVELKLSRTSSRGASVTAALQQYCVLNQILEFHSAMQAQLKRLQSLRAFLAGEQDALELHEAPQLDVAYVVEVARTTLADLSAVCRDLRAAANVLRLPSRRRFPYSAYVDHGFKPPLPPEVVVDFSIHRGELLMEVWGLALTQKPMVEIPDGCCSKKEFVGSVCMCRSQKVEIVDYASVSVSIPQLDETLSHLDEQATWLVRIRDNVKALVDCQRGD